MGNKPCVGRKSPFSVTSLLVASLLMILCSVARLPLRAQVGTADVLGTVTDTTGAVVLNAKVTITNRDTLAARTATTDNRGDFIFNLLPNGNYSLQVEAPNFKTYAVTFSLLAGDRTRIDASLQAGTVTEKVMVTGAVAVLQTDTSTLTTTIEDSMVQDLPLNNRNYYSEIQIQPGINGGHASSTITHQSPTSGNTSDDRRQDSMVVANGQSDQLNNQVLDGFDNNERLEGLVGFRPSIDGIAEAEVDTNSYRAEYGRTAGAVINVITKAGTDKYHGSAYDYFRNDIVDSRNFFAKVGQTPKGEYRQNNFGGSLGGPIVKGRTFFFFDLEEDRIIQGQTFSNFVPTQYERQYPGDLSDCGGPNLIQMGVPLSSVMMKYFNLYPMSTAGCGEPTYDTENGTQFGNAWDIRVDHRFSSKDLFFARYGHNPVDTTVPSPFPKDAATGFYPGFEGASEVGPSSTSSQNLQFDYVHTISSALLFDLKAGYTRIHVNAVPWNLGKGTSTYLGIPNVIVPGDPNTDIMPVVGGPDFQWTGEGDSPGVPEMNIDNTFQYSGSVIYTHGAHNVKIGAGVIRRQVNPYANGGIMFIYVAAPPFFDARANYLTGNPLFQDRNNQLYRTSYRTWEPSFYAQDDWRLTRKVTLNLGVRYDIFTPFTEAQGRYSNFVPDTLSSGVGSRNFILGNQSATTGVKTDYHDIAPRVGFAYSLDQKTVLRGGFGMSFYPADVGTNVFSAFANPPYYFSLMQFFPGNLTSLPLLTQVDLTTYASNPDVTSLVAKPSNFHSSYVEQMNLALQREVGANTLTAAYVAVLGRQLARSINLDQPDPPGAGNAAPPYVYSSQLPFVNTITENYNGAMSSYNALQLIYSRRLTHGLTISANYTWAHGLTNAATGGLNVPEENDNPSIDYGNSAIDIRHRIAVAGSYQLPFGKSLTGVKGLLASGWQLNSIVHWQTGLPFTVFSETANPATGNLYINQPGVSYERPNVVGSTRVSNPSLKEWFNIDAFTPQTSGTVGDEGVNQLYAPHDRRADLSVFKIFRANELLKLQFRAECFNISNTPNFVVSQNIVIDGWMAGPNGQLVPTGPAQGSPFGTITDTAVDENPRQFQFALKLLF